MIKHDRWQHLVSESLFANELAKTGLRQLCSVPTGEGLFAASYSQRHALHVGLHSYTSGLERLCKLAISCHGYVATGNFPSLRQYGHDLSRLLDAVETLDMSAFDTHKVASRRPRDELETTFVELLDRFAQGSGRYEHLDSLSRIDINVTTLDTWSSLCARVSVPDRVREIRSLRDAVLNALRTLSTKENLEASTYSLLEFLDSHLSDPSVAVALRLYRRVNWVASVLDVTTYYTNSDLPLLGEAVQDLQGADESFFQYLVALVEDEDVAQEELQAFYERHHPDEDDWEDVDEDDWEDVDDEKVTVDPPRLWSEDS